MTETEKQTFSFSTLEKLLHIGATVLEETISSKVPVEVTKKHIVIVGSQEVSSFSDEEIDEFVETMYNFRAEGRRIKYEG